MRYRLRDIPHLVSTPLGRKEFHYGVRHRLWPLLSRLARLHRERIVAGTRVVSVVGSFGKTTTTQAVIAALGGGTHQELGLNCWSHVAEAVLRIRPSDPCAVLEVGIDGPGQMAGYARMVRPDVTVVTSIGTEHHRSLGSLSVTREEKSHMVRILAESATAVLNGDDPNVRWMAGETRARTVSFGFDETNDVFATDIVEEGTNGTSFRMHGVGKTHPMRVRLVGRHMLYPILAAAAVARGEGLSMEPVFRALQKLQPTPGRMQPVALSNGITLLCDDYKSSLETIHAALDVLSGMTAPRRIAVLGEVSEPPGSQGPIYREIGERLSGIVDQAIVVGGNFQRYAAGALRGGMPREALVPAGRSVLEAARLLGERMREGDLVLVKGRDTQRLERIACVLAGRPVRCDIDFCPTRITRCECCPMLERGWGGRRVVL